MAPTRAATRLREKVTPKPTEFSIADIARACRVTPQAVSAWTLGFTRPGKKYRAKLEKLAGIPASDWEIEEEEAADGRAA